MEYEVASENDSLERYAGTEQQPSKLSQKKLGKFHSSYQENAGQLAPKHGQGEPISWQKLFLSQNEVNFFWAEECERCVSDDKASYHKYCKEEYKEKTEGEEAHLKAPVHESNPQLGLHRRKSESRNETKPQLVRYKHLEYGQQ